MAYNISIGTKICGLNVRTLFCVTVVNASHLKDNYVKLTAARPMLSLTEIVHNLVFTFQLCMIYGDITEVVEKEALTVTRGILLSKAIISLMLLDNLENGAN